VAGDDDLTAIAGLAERVQEHPGGGRVQRALGFPMPVVLRLPPVSANRTMSTPSARGVPSEADCAWNRCRLPAPVASWVNWSVSLLPRLVVATPRIPGTILLQVLLDAGRIAAAVAPEPV